MTLPSRTKGGGHDTYATSAMTSGLILRLHFLPEFGETRLDPAEKMTRLQDLLVLCLLVVVLAFEVSDAARLIRSTFDFDRVWCCTKFCGWGQLCEDCSCYAYA
ncbi:hypothetical protein LSAT2_017219 [Lamellibrachia satsuma]|nr:hypothetical protein LSAT2_017219 [Lamellibrachia satsuma]